MEATTLHAQGETLLVVDDDPLMTDLIRQFMTKRNYRVLTASGGKEALRIVEAEAGTVDLVITDMTMPDMDGIALAHALDDTVPDLPVVIATGHEMELSQLDATPNVKAVVKKPYQNRALAERIREILDTRPM